MAVTPSHVPHPASFTRAARLWLATTCLAYLCAGWAAAAEVATRDGLALGLGRNGEVTSCRVDGRELLQAGAAGGLFVADVKDIPAENKQIAANPSFEQAVAGKPVGWEVGGDWQLDRQVARTGKASMRVNVPGPNKRPSGSLAIDVPVKPNTPHRVSMWMRTKGCAPSFYIVQYDAQGKQHRDYPQICMSHARKNSDWFELGHSFSTAFFCRKLRVYSNIWNQTGTAWLDDVSVVCLQDDYVSPQRLVTGKVGDTPDGVEQFCEVKGASLRVKARYRAMPNYIRVDGEVQDTSKSDRAVSVSFRLPIDAAGWTWYDDLDNSQPIEPGVCYGAARVMGERRQTALYPFAGMGRGQTALALAVPMDMPRAFRLCYDSRIGFYVNYEFGLTQAATKLSGRAGFRLYLYRTEPQWGFRSAAKRYYDAFPEFFVKRVEREGGAGFMADRERFESPDFIAPAFAIFNWHQRHALPAHRRELVKVFPYTEFIGWWGWAIGVKPAQAATKPSHEEAWAYVEKLAQGDPPNNVARCILNCVPHDSEGKRRLHRSYVPKWGGYNYLCSPEPEIVGIGGKLNRVTLTYDREVKQVDAHEADGMYYDCAFVFTTDNFRREHFQWADHPLAFDHVSKKPVVPMAFSIYECAQAISDDMHARGKLVMSNYSVTREPTNLFCIQFIDVIGNEMLWTWCTDAKFALQRTLAYQKTVSMSWQEAKNTWAAERIEPQVKQAMFYGTFYYLSGMSREVHERWEPLTRRLAAAGWEPVTHARTNDPAVRVERFGSVPNRSLHFTLRNDAGEPKQVELSMDTRALGLPAQSPVRCWLVRDSRTCERIDAPRADAAWSVKVAVPERDTVVLRVAAPCGIALDHLFTVPDQLRKAANYRDALREAGAKVVCPDYERQLREVQAGQQLLAAEEAQSQQALLKLKEIAAGLTQPRAEVGKDKTAAWRIRLADCSSKAKQGASTAAMALRDN